MIQIRKKRIRKRWLISAVIFVALMAAIAAVLWFSSQSSAPKSRERVEKTINRKINSPPNLASASFNKTLHSTTDPGSVWVVVNKQHPLIPNNYTPNNLGSIGNTQISLEALPSLQAMIAQAKVEGVNLQVISGYRSYGYQVNLYNSYVAQDGQAQADTYSARPGFSEHQTGLAADLGGIHGCDVEQCFGDTVEGKWLAEHATEYGFIIRYTIDKEDITGYTAEPWHIRFVGKELSSEMKKQGIKTLEEFFSISGGKQYIN